MAIGFRDYVFPAGHPRLAGLDGLDPVSYTDGLWDHPVAGEALTEWRRLFDSTRFTGITANGTTVPGLFPVGGDEAAPEGGAAAAALALMEHLSDQTRSVLCHPIDSGVWRAWMNPEFYLNRFGLRLEEQPEPTRKLAMDLLQTSLSPEGFDLVRNIMRSNAFLGDLVGLPRLLNEYSYNINLFGVPSRDEPWGWSLYGHHLCLSSFFIGKQQVLTPVFFGAEPNEIDSGEFEGVRLLTEHEQAGLAFVRSLPAELADQAILYRAKRDPQMPASRLHPGDELHLGGCFQDNRVIPYEGLSIANCTAEQRESIVELIGVFLSYQPSSPRAARLDAVRAHLNDTWFSWIGGTGDNDPFYYRVQSPVVMVEFDHHAGIWLSNEQPQKFHIHTLVRTPNGNDYGAALIAQTTGHAHTLAGKA